jgi:hypothetical protein
MTIVRCKRCALEIPEEELDNSSFVGDAMNELWICANCTGIEDANQFLNQFTHQLGSDRCT